MCGACLMRLATGEFPLDDDPDETVAAFLGPDLGQLQGQRIGHYELVDEIARGGMGIVYRARQLNAGRDVALKVMLPHLLPLRGMLERFQHEVRAVAQLDHPGILPIYEVGEHSGLPYFSMKLAEGGSLDRRAGALRGDWRAIATLVAKLARAVEHAHSRGILHRDLKPANILFVRDEPMIGDFGLAKFRAAQSGLTLPASALGSPNYMAPEQVSAQFGDVGPPTDVYGLGAILYELLTSRPPVSGDDAIATMRLVTTSQPTSGVHESPDLPRDLDAIALKCLAKQPADRYASAADLAADLDRWLVNGTAQALTQARTRRLHKWGQRAAAVVLAMGVGIGGWFVARSSLESKVVPASAPAVAVRTIGVLPFRNTDADPDEDYLGSMVTDDLLRELRQVESLSVVPFRLDTAEGMQPEQLSQQLGVDVVLDGEFTHRDNNMLSVSARLWDANLRREIWHHSFDSPLSDVRVMRTQIATALVTRLQIAAGEDLRAQFKLDGLTGEPEAYRKYLRARYLLRWRRPETLVEAARLLREAIDLDPKFGRAHSALAYVYSLWVPPAPAEGDHWELAVQYARSAIAVDPTLGEPHAVLGNYYDIHEQPIDAELSLRQALALDPRDPATLHYFTIHLYGVGRLRDALEMERRSVALDSRSPQPMMWLAMITTLAGERADALRLWQQADDLGAARPLSAALSRLELGQTEPLLEWYRTTLERSGVPAAQQQPQLLVDGILDPAKRAAALEWMRSVEASVDPAFAITHYAMLNDSDSAMRIASKYDLGDDFWYLYRLMNIWSPRTASLRRDPRFGGLLKRWGFVDYWERFGVGDLCTLTAQGATCR